MITVNQILSKNPATKHRELVLSGAIGCVMSTRYSNVIGTRLKEAPPRRAATKKGAKGVLIPGTQIKAK
jgi:hypothetical protein